jgi:hypothetical protein
MLLGERVSDPQVPFAERNLYFRAGLKHPPLHGTQLEPSLILPLLLPVCEGKRAHALTARLRAALDLGCLCGSRQPGVVKCLVGVLQRLQLERSLVA